MNKTTRASDPRARRTIAALQQALIDLAGTTPPHEVDVVELCRTAGLHRTTFYKHFTSVSELAATVIADLLERIECPSRLEEHGYGAWLSGVLDEAAQHRDTYNRFLGSGGDPVLTRAVAEQLLRSTEEALAAATRQGSAPAQERAVARMLAYAAYGLIETVIEDDGVDVDRSVDALVRQLPGSLRRTMVAA
ncbi:TetR/AcrR family transcriptional regulator [Georgenia sp. AZ-5]|uniref:TetR/AcrR family transcriptional regulator n=1 Tax=Georgenia sp. AZ-5 TaxID=3367526 RepID=UPI003754D1E3